MDFVHIQVQARLPSLVLTNLKHKEGCLKCSLDRGAKSIWIWLEVFNLGIVFNFKIQDFDVMLSEASFFFFTAIAAEQKQQKPNPTNPTPLNKQHLKQFIKKDKYKEEKLSCQGRNTTQWLEGLSVPKKGEKIQCLNWQCPSYVQKIWNWCNVGKVQGAKREART